MTNFEKVNAIRQAWHELMPEDPPITYGTGPAIDLDLYAQVAINVLTDWPKRFTTLTDRNGVEFGANCVHIGACRAKFTCRGTCKLP